MRLPYLAYHTGIQVQSVQGSGVVVVVGFVVVEGVAGAGVVGSGVGGIVLFGEPIQQCTL